MKPINLFLSLVLLSVAGAVEGETGGKAVAKCPQLAKEYADHPDSINVDRLRQLQFCINQALTKRKTTNPPSMLQGTIMELPSSSETSTPSVPKISDTKTP